MKNILKLCLVVIIYSACVPTLFGQSEHRKVWAVLGDVTFDTKQGEDILTMNITPPTFGAKVLALEGKEITIEGYVLPLDFEGNYFVISSTPFASCFFCGGSGPETVMEIYLKGKKKVKSKTVTVKGILKLNRGDLEHLTYMLENAEVVEK